MVVGCAECGYPHERWLTCYSAAKMRAEVKVRKATSWMGDAQHGSWALWCDESGGWFAAKRARVNEGELAEGESAPLPEWMSQDSGIADMLWGTHGEEEK